MKYATKLLCLVVTLTSAQAASISGALGLNRNRASFASALEFPRIPGFNDQESNNAPSVSSPFNPSAPGSSPPKPPAPSPPFGNPSALFAVPNARSLIPDLSSAANSADVSVPSINGLPDLSTLSRIPGLNLAIQSARNQLEAKLNLTSGIASGIQQAISEAFESNNPTAAVGTIIDTIINSYVTVAENCPLLIVGRRVIQEGIRLALEVARAAANVAFGTTTSTSTTTTSTDSPSSSSSTSSTTTTTTTTTTTPAP